MGGGCRISINAWLGADEGAGAAYLPVGFLVQKTPKKKVVLITPCALMVACKQCFLVAWIPFVAVVFVSIPPAILVPFVSLYAPDSLELLDQHFQRLIGNETVPEGEGGATRTKRGCKCQFPFTYGGKTYHSCMRIDGLYLDNEHKHQLWCDVGDGGCGVRYSPDDAAYTSRKCCYDSW